MFKIGNLQINSYSKPIVVAELSGNHNGNINKAFELIDKAVECNADAVKIQTYKPDTITINSNSDEFIIKEGPWKGKTLYELYEMAHTPWEWHAKLFEYAKIKNIPIFSSPFDETAVDLLEELNVEAYKIASFELVDDQLINYVASKKKPMIMSCGMANLEEIEHAVETARLHGSGEIILLHCVSSYPASFKDYNISILKDMEKRFGCYVGISDHSIDNSASIASVPLNSKLIEKHFTLDRNGGGVDDSFSLEPIEMANLTDQVKKVWESLGNPTYNLHKSEEQSHQFRRSIYFCKNLDKGDHIKVESVKSIRPGNGLPPKDLHKVIGKKVLMNVKSGTPVTMDIIDFES